MPVTREPDAPHPHRDKSIHDLVGHLALVTRQLTPSELRHNPSAQQALDHEWEKLANMGAWDASGVCEYEAARKRALEEGRNAHCGRLFGFSSENTLSFPRQKGNTNGVLCSRGMR